MDEYNFIDEEDSIIISISNDDSEQELIDVCDIESKDAQNFVAESDQIEGNIFIASCTCEYFIHKNVFSSCREKNEKKSYTQISDCQRAC